MLAVEAAQPHSLPMDSGAALDVAGNVLYPQGAIGCKRDGQRRPSLSDNIRMGQIDRRTMLCAIAAGVLAGACQMSCVAVAPDELEQYRWM